MFFTLFYVLIASGIIHDGKIEGFGTKSNCEEEANIMITHLSEPLPATGQPVFSYVKAWCVKVSQPQ